jgi:hypothetical protein
LSWLDASESRVRQAFGVRMVKKTYRMGSHYFELAFALREELRAFVANFSQREFGLRENLGKRIIAPACLYLG